MNWRVSFHALRPRFPRDDVAEALGACLTVAERPDQNARMELRVLIAEICAILKRK